MLREENVVAPSLPELPSRTEFAMTHWSACRLLCGLLASLLVAVAIANPAAAQESFKLLIQPETQGSERSTQRNLWIMEVHLKPMRLIWVETPDPQSGELSRQPFWYLCYRATNRIVARPEESAPIPQNVIDPIPGPDKFVPQFTMVLNDSDAAQTHQDVIEPTVLAAIRKLEGRSFLSSVQAVQDLPAATSDPADDENSIYGVAIFRDVDPDTDRYTVFLSGFSNGYQIDADNPGVTLRKTIAVDFFHPGDRFDANNSEFRFDGEPRWIYRPEPVGQLADTP